MSQGIAMSIVITYYTFLMAVTAKYIYDSFSATLPWSVCLAEYGDHCIPSSETDIAELIKNNTVKFQTSAELYFR